MAQHSFTGATQAKAAFLDYIQVDLTELFTYASEVAEARDGESTLLAQIDLLQQTGTEVTDARGGETSLSDRLDELSDITTLGYPDPSGHTGKYLRWAGLGLNWEAVDLSGGDAATLEGQTLEQIQTDALIAAMLFN